MSIDKQKVQKAMSDLYEPCCLMIAAAKKDLSTKDGYGYVMGQLSRFKKGERGMVICALVEAGYPEDTADTLARMDDLDWNVYRSFQSILHSPVKNA